MEKVYEIQTFTLCEGWVNCETFDNGEKMTFSTKEEAEAYLVGFAVDMNKAYADGFLDDEFDESDYRIEEVSA
jgi:hypothetical protein